MAKGKQKKQSPKSPTPRETGEDAGPDASADANADGTSPGEEAAARPDPSTRNAAGQEENEAGRGPAGASPYDREPDAGAGALVFLGIIAALLAGAVVVGLLQGQ